MKITCLAENTSCRQNIGAEHGLSLYIETSDKKILFDMGQTELFAHNAEKLGIDLGDVDTAVLSHGHYDHGGGLDTFLAINKKAPVYLSVHAFEPHYNGTAKYIGLDVRLKNEPRLVFTGDHQKLSDNMELFSCKNMKKFSDLGSFGLNMVKDGEFLPDDFRHEQYLLIEENGKRILISGCSHKGIINLARWFRPHVLVGGFHFSKIPPGAELASYAAELESLPTNFITCHCTGEAQFAFMKEHMTRLSYLSSGQTINI